LAKNLNLNLELTYAALNDNIWGTYSLTQISPVISFRFAKHFKIYVGPSLNVHVQNDHFKYSESSRFVNMPYNFFNPTFNYIWAGLVAKM